MEEGDEKKIGNQKQKKPTHFDSLDCSSRTSTTTRHIYLFEINNDKGVTVFIIKREINKLVQMLNQK